MSCETGFQRPQVGCVLPWINKDPRSTLDYTVDWTEWLGTGVITAVTWTVPPGLVEEASSFTDTTATIWLSGDPSSEDDAVTCQISSGDRVAVQSFQVRTAEL